MDPARGGRQASRRGRKRALGAGAHAVPDGRAAGGAARAAQAGHRQRARADPRAPACDAGGRSTGQAGVLKPGLKERRRLVREAPEIRGRWTLFPRVLHPGRSGRAIQAPGEENVLQLTRSEFLYVTRRTRGSRGEQLTEHQKRQGSIWSQRNICTATSSSRPEKPQGFRSRSTTLATHSCPRSWPPGFRCRRSPRTAATPWVSWPLWLPATGGCARRQRSPYTRTRPARLVSARLRQLASTSHGYLPRPRGCAQRWRPDCGERASEPHPQLADSASARAGRRRRTIASYRFVLMRDAGVPSIGAPRTSRQPAASMSGTSAPPE